ncbi:unnamed protein product, partial [marine sediment metagenome]
MPADDSRSQSGKPGPSGWRGKPPSSPRTGRSARQKSGGWAEKKDRDYERAALRHRTRIVLWSLLFIVLIAVFIRWLIPKPMPTPFLVAVVTDYQQPVPPNAWTTEDVEQLRSLHDERILKYTKVAWESEESGLKHLRQALDAATPGGPDKDLVIIYLSMHGLVDGEGKPCLLPPGASPLHSDGWLRVRDLINYLFPKQTPGKQPAKVKKLLILDCNRMDVNWNLGLLYNSFAERLQAVVEEESVPGLVVLNSSGPGQIGWAAPELENSVFGHYLWRGLRGEADAEQTGNRDGKIHLRELHDYLKAQVSHWVKVNRHDVQEPMLLPHDVDDFPLAHAKPREKPSPQNDKAPRWNDIELLWETHAKLRDKPNPPHRWNPLGWEEFQHKLLRL